MNLHANSMWVMFMESVVVVFSCKITRLVAEKMEKEKNWAFCNFSRQLKGLFKITYSLSASEKWGSLRFQDFNVFPFLFLNFF